MNFLSFLFILNKKLTIAFLQNAITYVLKALFDKITRLIRDIKDRKTDNLRSLLI